LFPGVTYRWLFKMAAACSAFVIVAPTHTIARGQELQAIAHETTEPTTQPATTQPVLSWEAQWNGWEGLDIEFIDRTHWRTVSEILMRTPEEAIADQRVRFAANFGARLEVDAAQLGASGTLNDFDSGVALRRLSLISRGMFQFVAPIDFKLELGYIPGKFNVKDAYLVFPEIDYVGRVKFGFFQPPMGLDLMTSSRDLMFMEPAAPLQALAPGNEFGIQIGRPVFDERATWVLGIFGNGQRSGEYGNASKNYGSAIGRATWLAIDHLNPQTPVLNQSLHLGVSANYQYSTTSTVRYRSRPESYIAPHVIDTGEITSRKAATLGAEAAWVSGPLSVQSEFLDSSLDVDNGPDVNFYGFYVYASYFVTGESRAYDRKAADFERVKPLHDFAFGRQGWGALELGGRISYTNLTNGDIRGGRLGILMGEANWYLQPHVRWMLGTGYGHVDGSSNNGDMFILQTRLAVDF
jgi:phosphate-selective porin OprO/OprP